MTNQSTFKNEDSKTRRYTVTSALPYANGPLHIGHIAGAYLPADIYVRYLRLKGRDVVYICGSDEHGAAITLRARKEGISPKDIVDKYDAQIKKSFEEFGIDFDIYHRTSSELHHKTAADFFKVLYDKGEFIEQTTEQYFDEEQQLFLADRYITGTCPKCSYKNAYGDQCEKCGSTLSPKELVDPRSTISGKKPVLKQTTHWFLPLNKFEDWLKEWIIDGHKDDWKANVYGQCRSWIEGGLKPRAMTRDLDWGVKVPLDQAEGKVLYVWLDAPIGYISATKQWAEDNGKDWEVYWKDEHTKLVHFIGKDNIVFHCIIFPILLKAHGEFIMPDNVPANEFLNLEGDKFSTSRNWAVWLDDYLKDFPGKQDELRYVLTLYSPETSDNEFTWKDFQAGVNNELVAVLGNFVNRVVVLIHKYFDGKIPVSDTDDVLSENIKNTYNEVEDHLECYEFRAAQNSAMSLARTGNKYLSDNEPWKLIKTDSEKTAEILSNSLQVIAHLSVLLAPFLPSTSRKIADLLNLNTSEFSWNGECILLQGEQKIKKPEFLFTKIEDEEIDTQTQKLEKIKKEVEALD